MNKAFTLVESLVTIFIIAILSLIVIPNYNSIRQQLALQRSAFKLSQDIRAVQEMAMSAKELGGEIPAGGYGIYLRQGDSDYLLYADTSPANGNEIYSGGDDIIEIINLEKGVKIEDVSPASMSINFKPPDTSVSISGGEEEAVITISLESDPSRTRIIKVNKAGLIYVE